jgi:hypothetical protein
MNKCRISALIIGFYSVLSLSSSFAQTNEAKGWQKLFNGKDLTGWKKLAGDANYTVENGTLVGTTVLNTGNTFLVTEKEYGDFILELDVKAEKTNSGVQTRSHFDPAGNKGKGMVYGRQVEFDPSDRKWSGGIYDEARRMWLYPLDLNPQSKEAFKLTEFNHIKIECIGNTTKTWVNGIATAYVVDTLDKQGFIGLQVHAVDKAEDAGQKIYFKNINIKTTNLRPEPFDKEVYEVNFTPNSLTNEEKSSGWKLLFDGKTNNGWRSAKGNSFPAKGWEIKNGTLSVLPAQGTEAGNGGDIVTLQEYKAFDVSFEFKLTPGANSGMKYYVTLNEKTEGSAIGPEYQVLDDELHPDAKLGRDGNRTLASLYDLITSKKQPRFLRPIGTWNNARIVAYPDHRVIHYLNGVKVLEYTRGSKEFRDLVQISKYKDWKNFGEAEQGHILLQDHGNAVSYRSIKIKALN